MKIEINEELGVEVSPKKKQPWKTDIYVGISVGRSLPQHEHLVASGAIVLGTGFIEGDFYYWRNMPQKVLINRNEDGKEINR